MFVVKQKPQLPNAFGLILTAEFAIMSGNLFYLLPGVTKQGRDLAMLPVFKAGEKGSPRSFRDIISKLKVFVWYDLPLAAKQEALEALKVHFHGNIEEIARLLGHTKEYVLQLPQAVSDFAEYELAVKTKVENRLTTSSGVAKDPMKFFEMPADTGRAFLEETVDAWKARTFEGGDLFLEETIKTANKTALKFLLRLGKDRLLNKEQIMTILMVSEQRNDYDFLPELCRTLHFQIDPLKELSEFLFPDTESVKKMCDSQLQWRIQLLNEVKTPIQAVPWIPAFKELTPFCLIKIGAHLLTRYLIENIAPQKLWVAYPETKRRGEKASTEMLRADSPDAEVRAHYNKLNLWAQTIWEGHVQQGDRLSEISFMVLMVQTALFDMDVKHWPSFLMKYLENDDIKKSLVTLLLDMVEKKQINIEHCADGKQHLSVLGQIFSCLSPNQQTAIRLYEKVISLSSTFTQPGYRLERQSLMDINNYLNVLLELLSAEQKTRVESLPFYKVISAIAALGAEKTQPLTPFEIKLLSGLLKQAPAFVEHFADDPLTSKVLINIVSSLDKLPLFHPKVPMVDVKKPDPIVIPPKGSREEQLWLDEKVAAFDNAAQQFVKTQPHRGDDALLAARGLQHIRHRIAAIERDYMKHWQGSERGIDGIYASEGVLIHYINSVNYDPKMRTYIPSWQRMNHILEDILYRCLTMFALAMEWQRIEGHPEKLEALFKGLTGLCMESRTRTLFDNPPAWYQEVQMAEAADPQKAVLDNMDALREKIEKIVAEHKAYFAQNHQSFIMADAIDCLWAWYDGQSYQDESGETVALTRDHIETIVSNMEVVENAAASLLAAAPAPVLPPAGQPALHREGLFPWQGGQGAAAAGRDQNRKNFPPRL